MYQLYMVKICHVSKKIHIVYAINSNVQLYYENEQLTRPLYQIELRIMSRIIKQLSSMEIQFEASRKYRRYLYDCNDIFYATHSYSVIRVYNKIDIFRRVRIDYLVAVQPCLSVNENIIENSETDGNTCCTLIGSGESWKRHLFSNKTTFLVPRTYVRSV